MSPLGFILYLIFAAGIGITISFLVVRIMIKNTQEKIKRESIKNIMKQDYSFVIDGKKYDLKNNVEKSLKESGINIQDYLTEPEIKKNILQRLLVKNVK